MATTSTVSLTLGQSSIVTAGLPVRPLRMTEDTGPSLPWPTLALPEPSGEGLRLVSSSVRVPANWPWSPCLPRLGGRERPSGRLSIVFRNHLPVTARTKRPSGDRPPRVVHRHLRAYRSSPNLRPGSPSPAHKAQGG